MVAIEARRRLGLVELVTTDKVLTEFFAALSKQGPQVRLAAARAARAIPSGSSANVIAARGRTLRKH